MPAVSIVIRTYNRAETILDAIASAERQTFEDREIIVVDDGSTDSTHELLQNRPGLRYHAQPNQGIVGARSTGISLATGKYVALLDSDDRWDPDYLRVMIAAMEEHNAGIGFCDLQRKLEGDEALLEGFCKNSKVLKPLLPQGGIHALTSEQLRWIFIESMPAPSSAMVLNRSICSCEWNGVVRVLDDWFMAIDAIFRHHPAGVFVAETLVTKAVLESGVYEGRRRGTEFRKWYYKDREHAARIFKRHLSKAERRTWDQDMAEVAFDEAYSSAKSGRVADAAAWYLRAACRGRGAASCLGLLKLPLTALRHRLLSGRPPR